MPPGNPREAILSAAQRLFAERGYDDVSTAEVCRASGASNGSMFHFFPTKQALAGALYLRALESYQRMVVTGLARSPTARAGIRGFVLRHVRWVAAKPELARLLHEQRWADSAQAVDERIQAANGAFMLRVSEWLEPHVRSGAILELPQGVFLAVVFGPVHMLTRDALGDGDFRGLRRAAPALADSAWRAVARERPARKRRSSSGR